MVPHQSISLHLKRKYSIPLNSDFHLCNHALFFHLLFQFIVLCCQWIQENGPWHMWFLFFLFLQKSYTDHSKNIICQQSSSPAYPSVVMITLYSPKGFPFFSKCCICLLPPLFPASLSYSLCCNWSNFHSNLLTNIENHSRKLEIFLFLFKKKLFWSISQLGELASSQWSWLIWNGNSQDGAL